MTTKLKYLDDFNVTSGTAKVLAVNILEDGRADVVLNETCFYPRGGGQDWDKGTITTGNKIFNVDEVRLDEEGNVHHIGTMVGTALTPGEDVTLSVEIARRELNSRIHSAGHLIDLAVDRLGLAWLPGRGAHYPDMAFVEYSGEWNADQAETLRSQVEAEVNKLVSEGGKNEIRFMPKEEMYKICRHVPDYVPTNKPGRVVIYHGDFGVPCGGTHVRDLGEVGAVSIRKIKKKDKAIRVSYALTIERLSKVAGAPLINM